VLAASLAKLASLIMGERCAAAPWLLSMTDSEDYPLMTVGELAHALGVPREFVYRHAAAICLLLPDATVAIRRSSNAAGHCAFRGAHDSLSNEPLAARRFSRRPPMLRRLNLSRIHQKPSTK
jgi:hypothetical protein